MGGISLKTVKSVIIPTYSDKSPRWEVKVDLSGNRYTFEVSYNARQDAWLMNIKDVNSAYLIAGLRLVPEIELLGKYRASCPGLPPGDLYLTDRERNPQTAEVTRDNLSSRFALTYMTTVEE
jgi:hypothetical protein